MNSHTFEATSILKYLGLSENYEPNPSEQPVAFLKKHIHELPPHLLQCFSTITSVKERSIIPIIRNRRLLYTASQPTELSFEVAKDKWPTLWPGRERPGQSEGAEEKRWVNREFMGGAKQQVGKLGSLMGDYAEEREAGRIRMLRRQAVEDVFVPEEDDDDDESEESDTDVPHESQEEMRETFERAIKERFIYGVLDLVDYDTVDWSDQWDHETERENEERWFDEEEESETVPVEHE